MVRPFALLMTIVLCALVAGCSSNKKANTGDSSNTEDRGTSAAGSTTDSSDSGPSSADQETVVDEEPPPDIDVTPIVEGGNQFAFDLYHTLSAQQSGNLFFSPGSISMALAMAYAGADGTTEEEIAKTLHFSVTESDVHDAMHALRHLWSVADPKKGYRLSIANRLWAKQGFEFLTDFLAITRRKYGAELAELDFAGMTEQARLTINKWVADHTADKIVDLIPSGALAPESLLVLTNAVYFKGDWAHPFDKGQTQDEDFQVSMTEAIKVPLMTQQDKFGYAEAEGLQVLNMPYGDGTMAMTILLPEKVDGLGELESQLTAEKLGEWLGMLHEREVNVQLPRFQSRSQFELNGALRSLGLIAAFDASRANFYGMTGAKDLFISTVIHQAFVDVNEEGTEAAAATAIILAPTAIPEEPPVFRADHPFVFMIRDTRNGAILFLGRLVRPTPAL